MTSANYSREKTRACSVVRKFIRNADLGLQRKIFNHFNCYFLKNFVNQLGNTMEIFDQWMVIFRANARAQNSDNSVSGHLSKSFLVCASYRPPNSNINLINDFESFLHNSDLENQELLIIGDLNFDLSKSPLDSSTRKLLFLSSLYKLDQLIN